MCYEYEYTDLDLDNHNDDIDVIDDFEQQTREKYQFPPTTMMNSLF